MSDAHEDEDRSAGIAAMKEAIDAMAADAKAHPSAADEAARAAALRAVLVKYAVPDRRLVGKLPKGGAKLDYVGHAEITAILIGIDPLWSWEPVAWDDDGGPKIRDGGKVWELWGRVTLLGKTLPAVGSVEKFLDTAQKQPKADVGKELIGDLLRNAGLRFGIATSLWSRAERWDTGLIAGGQQPAQRPQERPRPAPVPEPRPERPAAAEAAPAGKAGPDDDWVEMAFDEACSSGQGRTRLLSASRDMAQSAGVTQPKTIEEVRTHPMRVEFAAWAAENRHAQAS